MKNKNKGFTLIELLVVIAIISLLSTTVMASLSGARQKSRDAKRIQDLKAIQTALEMYYSDNNGYPNPGWGWRSECPAWGGLSANNVIPGLVPNYLAKMPSAPMMDKNANTDCYLYLSDGVNYKILGHNSPDINYLSQPSLVDPARDSGPNGCAIDGTGVWSWAISSQSGTGSSCW
jgi:prepilin-type N-terminal cleavage/methylation domain-containing protein